MPAARQQIPPLIADYNLKNPMAECCSSLAVAARYFHAVSA